MLILSAIFICTVIIVKYKPAYIVTVGGKTLGVISKDNNLDKDIEKYKNHREGTIALIDIVNMPTYEFTLVSRDTRFNESEIYEEVKDSAIITYKTYAITLNGENIAEVDTEIEAEDIITRLKDGLNENIEYELAIVEMFSTTQNGIDSESAFNQLNDIKIAKTQAYEEEQARLEAERIERERQEAAERARLAAISYSSVQGISSSVGSGNIGGLSLSYPLPTTPLITSRFGESSGSRSYVHTGVDLATSLGTPIYAVAAGTVITATYNGSYGNMIAIDHGDGIQSWYAHCNSLNVSVGQTVDAGTMIATVGSTGNSTGPHLHLEIRINGQAVNPQNYLY